MSDGIGDIWDDIGKAKASQRGQLFNEGKYRVTVLNCENKRTHKMKIRGGIFTRCLIDEVLETKPGVEPSPVGSQKDHIINLDNPRAQGSELSDAKALALALTCKKESEVTAEDCAKAMRKIFHEMKAQQPLRGKTAVVDVFKRPTKDGVGVFTVHQWEMVKQTPDELKERRAQVEPLCGGMTGG